MIVDLERDEIPPSFSADVCIVGAGAAGIVLAAQLVRQGRRVLLLESGGEVVEPQPQALSTCEHTGQPRRETGMGWCRALGGTTNAWGGQVGEANADDFAERSWIPGSGWPISYAELQPYYERALQSEGLSSAIKNDDTVWQALKMPAPSLGDTLETYFTRWCPEPNFARLFRGALNSPNVCVALHATAIAMRLNEHGTRVNGIECRTIGGRTKVFCAAQYVLCLGTIETVRFLLQPRPNGQAYPWDRSGLLGRHFQSHIDFNAALVPSAGAVRLHPWFANVYLHGHKYHPKFRLAHSTQQADEILNIAGSITCIDPKEQDLRRAKALARNLVRGRVTAAAWSDLPRALLRLPTMLRLAYVYRMQHRAYWPKGSAFWLRVHCEQEPLSASRITLIDKRDPTGMRRVRVDWRVSPLEWRTMQRFAGHVRQAFSSCHSADIEIVPELREDNGFCGITFDNSHHDMGGTRMSVSAANGIVDPQLRLHGIDNAYVCSASVFPTSGFSNPTHTLIALAIRLADHLVSRQKIEQGIEMSPLPASESAGEVEAATVPVDPVTDASDA